MNSSYQELNISIKGFKAFSEESHVSPKKLNIVIGQNSSGKSSLIHFFQLLSNSLLNDTGVPLTYSPADSLHKDLINFTNIIHNHNKETEFEFSYSEYLVKSSDNKKENQKVKFKTIWTIALDIDGQEKVKEIKFYLSKTNNDKLFHILTLNPTEMALPKKSTKRNPGKIPREYSVSFANFKNMDSLIFNKEIRDGIFLFKQFKNRQKNDQSEDESNKKELININRSQASKIFTSELVFLVDGILITGVGVKQEGKKYGLPTDFIFGALAAAQNYVKSFFEAADFVGPIREQIRPVYPMPNAYPGRSVGYAGHKMGNFFGKKTTKEKINEVMKKLEIPYTLNVAKNDSIQMNSIYFENCQGICLRPDSLGTGISQVLPVIAAIASHDNGPLFIEQPELHLHPRMHEKLAEWIALESTSKENNTALFLETHSETFLKAILYYSKKFKLSKNDISIICVNSLNGNSTIQTLNIDDDYSINGPIDWSIYPLAGFFGELE